MDLDLNSLQKVIDERAKVESLLNSLNKFYFSSTTYRGLGDEGTEMLLNTIHAMKQYSRDLTNYICEYK